MDQIHEYSYSKPEARGTDVVCSVACSPRLAGLQVGRLSARGSRGRPPTSPATRGGKDQSPRHGLILMKK